MAVYSRQIANAKRAIKQKGEKVQWISDSATVPDPDKPWEQIPGMSVAHTVTIVFLPNNRTFLKSMALIMNKDVSFGNVKGLMAAVDFVPDVKGKVIRGDGSTLLVKTIDELNVNGESILFTIEFTSE